MFESICHVVVSLLSRPRFNSAVVSFASVPDNVVSVPFFVVEMFPVHFRVVSIPSRFVYYVFCVVVVPFQFRFWL